MTIETRISKLEAKLKEEKAKKQKADALQRTRTAKRSRQDDTRRKVLVGALVILRAQKDPAYKADLGQMLNQALTRPDDRALFGLDEAPSKGAPESA